MNKEFVPYEQALALKELGFDEPCFGLYGKIAGTLFRVIVDDLDVVDEIHFIKALTFSQAFRFFREKCGLFSSIQELNIGYQHSYYFVVNDEDSIQFLKYEDAELACLDKLISIIKEQQNEII